MPAHHLVTVWNPSYAKNAMEEHLAVLRHLSSEHDEGRLADDQLYVWWGKVRSPSRQQPQAHMDQIRAIARALDGDGRDEVQLYLTDYRSLYVGEVEAIVEGDLPPPRPATSRTTTAARTSPATSGSSWLTSACWCRTTCRR